jgi:hypothetical protein
MQLGATIPVVRTFDEQKAKETYGDFLGFAIDWEHRFGNRLTFSERIDADT